MARGSNRSFIISFVNLILNYIISVNKCQVNIDKNLTIIPTCDIILVF